MAGQMMAPNARRLAGSAGANAAVGAFAVAAASHGTTGLIIGAIVVSTTALLEADWLVLFMLNRQQRWAWRKTSNKTPTDKTDTSPGANS